MTSQNPEYNFIVVDDDPLNNTICKLTLQSILGPVKTQTFTNGLEGLEYIMTVFPSEKHTIQTVLFLDINMPVMNGWEFLERFDNLRTELKNLIRIYILSSSVDERDKERSYANKNVNAFLVKPLTGEAIAQVINECAPIGR